MNWWDTNKKTVYAVGAVATVASFVVILMYNEKPKRKSSRNFYADDTRWRERKDARIRRETAANFARRAKSSFQMAKKTARGR